MTALDALIVRGRQKIIDHYRWRRDTAPSDMERDRFQRCMQEEEHTLRAFIEQRSRPVRHAA